MSSNQGPKTLLEGSNHNLDYQTSFRPPSPDNYLSDLHRPLTTVFPISVARRLQSLQPPLSTWSFRPSLSDNDHSNLHRPPTRVILTSIAADYGPYDLHHRQSSFQPPSPADYGPSDLRHWTTFISLGGYLRNGVRDLKNLEKLDPTHALLNQLKSSPKLTVGELIGIPVSSFSSEPFFKRARRCFQSAAASGKNAETNENREKPLQLYILLTINPFCSLFLRRTKLRLLSKPLLS
ncbi:hypothetical protein M5K25_015806 [Dendrobium thyrsiflorum]|uniref:Uncharacterized protein n=1 Tax=Dendrobium thyrsiflorum TaxID=117978 RepID=A0ABD0UR95_DENTH